MVQKDEFSNQADSESFKRKRASESYDRKVKAYFIKIGIVPTYENRKKIAEQLGIKAYIGTKEQNKKLIERLKIGRKKK